MQLITHHIKKYKDSFLIGAFIGALNFYFLFGLGLLDPHHIFWLLSSNNQDAVQHFIGWEFFRNEPWHFPPGKIDRYGFPFKTSIVYTDSIPLLALFFKLFKNHLPLYFQYFGLWYAGCYLLQGIVGWKLAHYISEKTFIKIIITQFFVMSPIMLNRTIEHHALIAHWVVLAGILLYLRPYQHKREFYWLGLNALTVMIHAYLACMVIFLWIAALIKNVFIERNLKLRFAVLSMMIHFIFILFCAWLAGYFVISLAHDIEAEGYALKSMNLLAPFLPGQWMPIISGAWSNFLPANRGLSLGQQYEGFNYLGCGMIFLCFIAVFKVPKNVITKSNLFWLPLGLMCSGLFFFSLSNSIGFGTHLLFNYPLPDLFWYVTSTFRASGRFFWPVYYVIMMTIFLFIVRSSKTSTTAFLLLLALALQIADLSNKLMTIKQYFHSMSHASPIDHQNLININSSLYKTILFVPQVANPKTNIQNYENYIYYAATHQMAINNSYLARQNEKKLIHYGDKLLLTVRAGELKNDTIYIILKPELFSLLKNKLTSKDRIILSDPYYIIVPSQ